MADEKIVTLERGWVVVLRDLGVEPQDVLRRARLPIDLGAREGGRVTIDEYFALFTALEEQVGDPGFAVRLGSAMTAETFHPLFFAALCCADLTTATRRIGEYKRLVAPMAVMTASTPAGLEVEWRWDDPTWRPPRLLAAMELVFLVHLARMGTRERIEPVAVTHPTDLGAATALEAYFGVRPKVARRQTMTFRRADAARPFLTANESMWTAFEPELRRRLTKLDARVPLPERVRSVLLECLPSGESAIGDVARRLGLSARTLQRQLGEHGVSYRDLVRETRLALARHYLGSTTLSYAEIAFLVGFDEPSSFFRAFREWTGTTPEAARQGLS